MDQIIKLASSKHKKWISTLSISDVVGYLELIASSVPYKINFQKKFSEIPSVKGLQGELLFEQIFHKNMSKDYKLKNVAKTSKTGDYLIVYESLGLCKTYTILIDVKNYSSSIPTREIEKFHRDVEIRSGVVSGGMMLSIQSKITGFNKKFNFDNIMTDQGNTPIMYVQSDNPSIITELIKFMFAIMESKDKSAFNIGIDEEIMIALDQITYDIDNISTCISSLEDSKLTIEKELYSNIFRLYKCKHKLINDIQKIRKTVVESIDCNLEPSYPDHITQIIQKWSDDIPIGYESFLKEIWKLDNWNTSINMKKKEWNLSNEKNTICIKFNKTFIGVIIHIVTKKMLKFANEQKIGKITNQGFTCKLNEQSYSNILKLIQLI